MDLKRGLSFPTQDPQWVSKVAIGTLVSFVPIFNFVTYGYAMDTLRNVANGRETPLPEWNDWGNQWVRGLIGGVVIPLLWSLPLLVVACPLYFVAIASALNSSNGELSSGAGLAMGCAGLLIALGSLALSPLIMAAYTRYAVTNNFADAMPGPVLRTVRGYFRPWLMILLAGFAFALVVGLLFFCTAGIGSILFIPLSFYIQLVTAHWYAQAYRESSGRLVGPPSMV